MKVQCAYYTYVHVNSCFKQDNKPLGTIPLAGNKLVQHPNDPKLPNQYRFEIVSTLSHYVECYHTM